MAGAALGQLGAVAMGLAGLISVIRARRTRRAERAGRRGDAVADPVADRLRAERMDMERRMASYLASRETEPPPRNDRQRSD